jgi:glycerol-3-phosphate dehydrogenase
VERVLGGAVDESVLDAFVRDAAQSDMARTVGDVLARRSRALFLDARGALALAPAVARTLARGLGRDEGWARDQTEDFGRTVARHLPPGSG